jgi:hypothetical protein
VGAGLLPYTSDTAPVIDEPEPGRFVASGHVFGNAAEPMTAGHAAAGHAREPPRREEVLQIIGMRMWIEILAVREATPLHTPTSLKRLEKLLADGEQAMEGDGRAYTRANRALHEAMEAPAPEPIRHLIRDLWERLWQTRRTTALFETLPERIPGAQREHRAMVKAIRKGDAEAAGAAMGPSPLDDRGVGAGARQARLGLRDLVRLVVPAHALTHPRAQPPATRFRLRVEGGGEGVDARRDLLRRLRVDELLAGATEVEPHGPMQAPVATRAPLTVPPSPAPTGWVWSSA